MTDSEFKKECEDKLSSIFKSTCKDCGGDYKECLSVISFGRLPKGEIFMKVIYEDEVPTESEFIGKNVEIEKVSNNKIRIKGTDLTIPYRYTVSIYYCKHTKKY